MSVSPDTGMIRGLKRRQGPPRALEGLVGRWKAPLAVTEAYTVPITQFLALKA